MFKWVADEAKKRAEEAKKQAERIAKNSTSSDQGAINKDALDALKPKPR